MSAFSVRTILLAALAIFAGAVAGVDAQSAVSLDERGSDHFIVYSTRVPDRFVRESLDCAEICYRQLADQLGFIRYDFWTLENRARIYIFPDRESYLSQPGVPAWSAGAAQPSRKVIVTYQQNEGFFDSILPHEIGHIVLREAVGGRPIPLWLDEGVACWLEPARRQEADSLVRRALQQNRFVTATRLQRVSPQSLRGSNVGLFYSESVSLVTFLVSQYGKNGFHDFCSALREGKSVDEALSKAYSHLQNLADLDVAWEQYLRSR